MAYVYRDGFRGAHDLLLVCTVVEVAALTIKKSADSESFVVGDKVVVAVHNNIPVCHIVTKEE